MPNELQRIIIGRQPIYDSQLKVYAYELLFRSSASTTVSGVTAATADLATSMVINYAFMELGIERVLGNHIGFVNLTRNFLLSDDPMPFTQDKIVLEVLEDIEVDPQLIEAIEKLVQQGYTLALDDFIYQENLAPLVKLAKIIKVDVLGVEEASLRQHVDILKNYPVQLLAEKIETLEQYELCQQLGFELFQGYYFSRPTILEDKPLPKDQMKLFQIIEKLQDPDIEFEQIEQLIVQDVGLSYKLLRLLNSAAMELRRNVDSIQQALVMLGLKAIRTWTTLIALNTIQSHPAELMTNALIRAKMCEQLAPRYGVSEQTGFVLGVFSNIDVMMGLPMPKVLQSLPLNDEVKAALIAREGILGQLLTTVIAYKLGQWDSIDTAHTSLEQLSEIYIASTEWSIQTGQFL